MTSTIIQKVYASQSKDEQELAYNDWAENYEKDLWAMGYSAPLLAASTFTHFVSDKKSAVLDAGCGTGLQCEPLALLGFKNITGIDLSDGMLKIAEHKKIYSKLHKMAMGDGLELASNSFDAIISVGTITAGHAPASSFKDLVEVAKQRALIIFALRCDSEIGDDYWNCCLELQDEGKWKNKFSSQPFQMLPYGEPDVIGKVHVFEVL